MAQLKTVIKVKTDTDEFELYGRPCQLSAFSFIPPDRKLSKERTYYNADKKVGLVCILSRDFNSQLKYVNFMSKSRNIMR